MAIHFFEEDISYKLSKKTALKSWIRSVIEHEGNKMGDLNYILCSDEYLLQINKQYLDHDTYTDIVTFDTSENQSRTVDDRKSISGDVFISIERVKENAVKFGVTEMDELCRVLVHGALHLSGYKDKTKEQSKMMREKENFYLLRREF